MPGQRLARDLRHDTLGQNAFFVEGNRLICLVAFVEQRLLGDAGGRHLLGVTDDDGTIGAADATDGAGDPDLRRLVEDDDVVRGRRDIEEHRNRVRAGYGTRHQHADDVRMAGQQLAYFELATDFLELTAQIGDLACIARHIVASMIQHFFGSQPRDERAYQCTCIAEAQHHHVVLFAVELIEIGLEE